MRLELGVELVLAALLLHGARAHQLAIATRRFVIATHGFVPLEEHDTPALVSRSEVVARRVKLDGGYDIGC